MKISTRFPLSLLLVTLLAPLSAHAAAATGSYGLQGEPSDSRDVRDPLVAASLVVDGLFTGLQASSYLRKGHGDRSLAAFQLVTAGPIFAFSAALFGDGADDPTLIGVNVWTALLCTQSFVTLFSGHEIGRLPLGPNRDLRVTPALVGGQTAGLGFSGTF